jgi:hypothetical protein
VPFGQFPFLAALFVFPALGSGNGDTGYHISVGHTAGFGISSEIADNNAFVDGSHISLLELIN